MLDPSRDEELLELVWQGRGPVRDVEVTQDQDQHGDDEEEGGGRRLEEKVENASKRHSSRQITAENVIVAGGNIEGEARNLLFNPQNFGTLEKITRWRRKR